MRIYFFILVMLLAFSSFSQKKEDVYFQQNVDYQIEARLDDQQHTLTGHVTMQYTNNAPEDLKKIAIHLWPNAFKNKNTAYFKQQLRLGNVENYRTELVDLGYIDSLDFTINMEKTAFSLDPVHVDIGWLRLENPLKPGQSIEISTPFFVKIPSSISRLGHVHQSYQITQWYPKPAVYDRQGWHPMPYLDQGEFFSEFGSYDVTLHLPKNYVVAATGTLNTASEKQFLVERIAWSKTQDTTANVVIDTIPPSEDNYKTINYSAEHVHDFAWFADKRFRVDKSSVSIDGRSIETWAFYTKSQSAWWQNATNYLNRSVQFYSEEVGAYQYPSATAVQSPLSAGGGMEYPMITLIGLEANEMALDVVITHEVGHNWFYGMLANNERDFAWMDEGMNSFFEYKYIQNFYGQESTKFISSFLTKKGNLSDVETMIMDRQQQNKLMPITTPVELQDQTSYYLNAYEYPALAFQKLEKKIGQETFSKAIKNYFNNWNGKHPGPADLKAAFESECDCNLNWLFNDYLKKSAPITKDINHSKKSRLRFLGGVQHTAYQDINWSPMLGANAYDQGMIGLWLNNVQLPANKLTFSAIPMYSLGANDIVGTAEVRRNWNLKAGVFNRISARVNGRRFSFDEDDHYGFLNRYDKLEPELVFTLRPKSPSSLNHSEIRLRHAQIFQKFGVGLDFAERIFETRKRKYYLNELSFLHTRDHALAPSDTRVDLQQGKGFLKLQATYRQQLVYDRPDRGLFIHLFGGVLLQNNSPDANVNFQFNGTSSTSIFSNDYFYDHMLMGRNEQSGILSQQIFPRDAQLKTLSNIGISDNLMIGAGLSSNLPIPLPIHVYADLALYRDPFANKTNISYSAGFSVIIQRNLFEVYFPLLESQDIRESLTYDIREKYWEKISFLFNLNWLRPVEAGENFFDFLY